jgi:hypothetical protein
MEICPISPDGDTPKNNGVNRKYVLTPLPDSGILIVIDSSNGGHTMAYKVYRSCIPHKNVELAEVASIAEGEAFLAGIAKIICFEEDIENNAADAFLANGSVYCVEPIKSI